MFSSTGLRIFSVDFLSTSNMKTVISCDIEPRPSMGRWKGDWDRVKFEYEISCVSSYEQTTFDCLIPRHISFFKGQERGQRTKGLGLAYFSLPWSFALCACHQSHVLHALPYLVLTLPVEASEGEAATFDILKFSMAVRLRGHEQRKLNAVYSFFYYFVSSMPQHQAEF